jgi:hypothetical protein
MSYIWIGGFRVCRMLAPEAGGLLSSDLGCDCEILTISVE